MENVPIVAEGGAGGGSGHDGHTGGGGEKEMRGEESGSRSCMVSGQIPRTVRLL